MRIGWWTLGLIALVVSGCARKQASYGAAESGYVEMDFYDMEEALDDSYGAPAPPPPPASRAAPMAKREMAMAPAMEAPPPEPEPEPDGPPAADRMVHYDGWASLRTPRAEDLVAEVVERVEAAGGHVESRTLSRVTARVPVDAFDAVWDDVLAMGPVVRKELHADDVTDAFTDLSLRAESMRSTRDRLQELLAKATEERDKLELIQQIHRITEQLEVLEAQVRSLKDLAALSRLTVDAVAPDEGGRTLQALPAGMQWIDRLAAFDTEEGEALARPVDLAVPEGFVRLQPREARFSAADGALAWAFALPNDPQGDAAFWRNAVVDRIGEQLDDGTVSEAGGWAMVRFVEQGATEPYVWHLGFRIDGRRVEVLQVTYPNEAQEARYHDAVRAVLAGGAA